MFLRALLTVVYAMWAAAPALAASPVFGPLLVSSTLSDGASVILAYDPVRGGFLGTFATGGGLVTPGGMAFGSDGNLYVASEQTGEILRYDGKTGAYTDVFSNAVPLPVGITFGPDRDLYVVSQNNSVVKLDGKTGALLAALSAGNLNLPFADVFGPDGNLYVSSTFGAQVLRFNGKSGAYEKVFATDPNANFGPTGILFAPDGSFLASDFFNAQILRFDATGNLQGVFASGGQLNAPGGLAAGPGNMLYVANTGDSDVLRYDLTTGDLVDVFLAKSFSGPGQANFLLFAPALAAPVIAQNGIVDGIVNGASFTGGSVAPGEILTIFGQNMGPSTGMYYTVDSATQRVAAYSSGTRVLFDGEAAPVLFTQAQQVSVVAPYALAGKQQTAIQVEYLGQASTPVTEKVTQTAPGIFSAGSNGSGPGAILNPDGKTLNSASSPAPKGSVVSIYATGEGQTSPAGMDGAFVTNNPPQPVLAGTVTATIGGIAAHVNYAGGSPSSIAGLLQVNVVIPKNAPSGPVPVVITIGGVSSQPGITVEIQ